MKHSLLRRRTETVYIHMNLAAAESLAIFFFLLGYPGVRLKVSEWIHLISFNFLLLQFVLSFSVQEIIHLDRCFHLTCLHRFPPLSRAGDRGDRGDRGW